MCAFLPCKDSLVLSSDITLPHILSTAEWLPLHLRAGSAPKVHPSGPAHLLLHFYGPLPEIRGSSGRLKLLLLAGDDLQQSRASKYRSDSACPFHIHLPVIRLLGQLPQSSVAGCLLTLGSA
ncbi:hypothetical protein KC356_g168 [Hortaea werneckii]|nr:hypothetical protein KC356_g168 [Hortaea werneckii]